MKILIWIVQILTTIAFLAAGITKLIPSYSELAAQEGMGWVNDFTPTQITIICLLEILGALGVILPMIIGKFKKLVPLAAIGLALIMIGAAFTHIGRGEPIFVNVVLFLFAALTAFWKRSLLIR